jgi:hypothetical protein
MTALRVSPALLRAVVAANAVRSPLPPHCATAIAARSYGRDLLTEGEGWFLETVQALPSLSERQRMRLNEIAAKVERNR